MANSNRPPVRWTGDIAVYTETKHDYLSVALRAPTQADRDANNVFGVDEPEQLFAYLQACGLPVQSRCLSMSLGMDKGFVSAAIQNAGRNKDGPILDENGEQKMFRFAFKPEQLAKYPAKGFFVKTEWPHHKGPAFPVLQCFVVAKASTSKVQPLVRRDAEGNVIGAVGNVQPDAREGNKPANKPLPGRRA